MGEDKSALKKNIEAIKAIIKGGKKDGESTKETQNQTDRKR